MRERSRPVSIKRKDVTPAEAAADGGKSPGDGGTLPLFACRAFQKQTLARVSCRISAACVVAAFLRAIYSRTCRGRRVQGGLKPAYHRQFKFVEAEPGLRNRAYFPAPIVAQVRSKSMRYKALVPACVCVALAWPAVAATTPQSSMGSTPSAGSGGLGEQ